MLADLTSKSHLIRNYYIFSGFFTYVTDDGRHKSSYISLFDKWSNGSQSIKKNNLYELDTSVVKLHLANFKIHFHIILGLQYLRLV